MPRRSKFALVKGKVMIFSAKNKKDSYFLSFFGKFIYLCIANSKKDE